jgi:hypothetical protein
MLVPVVLVGGVTAAVVHVVHMIAVGHADVPAALAVAVPVVPELPVPGGLALVVVVPMIAVQVPVVHVVGVIVVRYGDVPASGPVGMAVTGVLVMLCHGKHLPQVLFAQVERA